MINFPDKGNDELLIDFPNKGVMLYSLIFFMKENVYYEFWQSGPSGDDLHFLQTHDYPCTIIFI